MVPTSQLALSPLEGGKEATEEGKKKREGGREKRNWKSLPTQHFFHGCLLFGVHGNKAPLPQTGGQAHSGRVRDRAPGPRRALLSPAPVSEDHATRRQSSSV